MKRTAFAFLVSSAVAFGACSSGTTPASDTKAAVEPVKKIWSKGRARSVSAADLSPSTTATRSGGKVSATIRATRALVAGVKQRAAVLEQEWVKAANAKGVDGAKVLVEFREEVKRVAAGK